MALINSGANVNAAANDGWTALHLASRNNNDLVATLLLNNGANIELRDSDGRTAFEDGADEKGKINKKKTSIDYDFYNFE